MTAIYGILYEHRLDDGTLRTPCYVVPLHVVEIVRDSTHRSQGMCYMQVIFTSDVSVPALGIRTTQKLAFGRTVPIATELQELLPHSTGVYGFQDAGNERIVGDGEFYESLTQTEARAKDLEQSVECCSLLPGA